MKITSAGVIRNEDKPRVGVLCGHSLSDGAWCDIDGDSIDLTWEEFIEDLKAEGVEEDSKEWQQIIDRAEFDSRVVLFGSWKKNAKGQYVPDESGEYAAVYSSDSNVVTVEWSKTVVRCHHTSPCYVMANGNGPCGDLDTPGDSVLAYSLPADMIRKGDDDAE